MSTGIIVLLVILVVMIAALVALYFMGKKAQARQEEQKAQMDKYNADSLKLGLDLDGGVSITYEAVGDKAPTDEQMNDTKFLKLTAR